MNYKLFNEYITLQALLKTTGILPSGGAIKSFIVENTILVNNEVETRRGRKLRVGDTVLLVEKELTISILSPTPEEFKNHQKEELEKQRVAELVKKINQQTKQKKTKSVPARFPGTRSCG